jgi:hypothetical protein
MKQTRHLADAVLVAMALRRLAARARASAARHLETCARCAQEVASLEALREYLDRPLADPPEAVVARAWTLMEPAAPRSTDSNRFRVARLIYDSGAVETAHGVRAPAASRHQVWRAPGADVDLRFEGPGLSVEPVLLGQILPRAARTTHPESGAVWMMQRGLRPVWTVFGPSGEFTLPVPSRRRWVLWLEWGSLRMRLVPR